MRLSSKTKYEKLEIKKLAQKQKLDSLHEEVTELERRVNEALMDSGDYTAILRQKVNIVQEIQTVKDSLELITKAMNEAEPEHIKSKLADIKKEMSQLNSEVEPLQKKYEEAKKAYLKAEAAFSTAHHKSVDRWQRLSKIKIDLQHRLYAIEPQTEPESGGEAFSAPGRMIARY